MKDKLAHLFHKRTLFLQGVLRVPHLQLAEHTRFFALHRQPRLVFSFLFVAHELLQLQLLTCIKYSNCLVFSAIDNVNICTFVIILTALVDASITSYDTKSNVSDIFRIYNVMRRTGCAAGETAALTLNATCPDVPYACRAR